MFRRMIIGSKYANFELARFLAINGKVDKAILYNMATHFIQEGDFQKLKLFHKLTEYDFKTPKLEQSLVGVAANWAEESSNLEMLKYILDNGGDLEERDYSEHWEIMLRNREYRPYIRRDENGKYYITARGLILTEDPSPGIRRLIDNY